MGINNERNVINIFEIENWVVIFVTGVSYYHMFQIILMCGIFGCVRHFILKVRTYCQIVYKCTGSVSVHEYLSSCLKAFSMKYFKNKKSDCVYGEMMLLTRLSEQTF